MGNQSEKQEELNVFQMYLDEIKDIKDFESSYPPLMPIINKHLFRKILLLIVSLISITVVAINYFLTPNFKWSIFVILQLIASYRVFYNILS